MSQQFFFVRDECEKCYSLYFIHQISSGGNDTKPAVWIDAGIHSREWVAPATALYMIDRLLTGYQTDKSITELIDTHDWYILPVVNPDGYLHTWNWVSEIKFVKILAICNFFSHFTKLILIAKNDTTNNV